MKTADRNAIKKPAWPGISVLPDMDERQFTLWADLLAQRTGIVLPQERKSFLVTNLALRMREIGCADYQEYYRQIHAGRSGALEWATLVDRLTVHETRFFRHAPSLSLIRDEFLPGLKRDSHSPLSLQVWSVGCATGEEAYSLAVVLDQHLQSLQGRHYFGVTATDISLAALTVARHGVYHRQRLKDLSPVLRAHYFTALDGDRFQVCERLRQRVCFAQMNILDEKPVSLGMMDIVYCQNLLIYFDRTRRIAILERLVRHLRPGGLLVLGPGEIVRWEHPALARVDRRDTLVFRRHAARDMPGARGEV